MVKLYKNFPRDMHLSDSAITQSGAICGLASCYSLVLVIRKDHHLISKVVANVSRRI